jgi:hypothetical protein
MSKFTTWLDTLIAEKGIDTEQTLQVEGESGLNMIPVGCVIEAIQGAGSVEQQQIKNTLVAIDFKNGDILHFIRHLAQALAQ